MMVGQKSRRIKKFVSMVKGNEKDFYLMVIIISGLLHNHQIHQTGFNKILQMGLKQWLMELLLQVVQEDIYLIVIIFSKRISFTHILG